MKPDKGGHVLAPVGIWVVVGGGDADGNAVFLSFGVQNDDVGVAFAGTLGEDLEPSGLVDDDALRLKARPSRSHLGRVASKPLNPNVTIIFNFTKFTGLIYNSYFKEEGILVAFCDSSIVPVVEGQVFKVT